MSASAGAEVLIAFGLLAVGVAVRQGAVRRRRLWTIGRYRAVDTDGHGVLRSDRHRLVGRPDAIRERPDGRLIPVEYKSRSSPAAVPWSHEVQVWAYCLLVEEAFGRSPPFGIVAYSDGVEWQIPWDGAARDGLGHLLEEVRRPYAGQARASRARCAACPYRPVCSARAV